MQKGRGGEKREVQEGEKTQVNTLDSHCCER